jgi:hypothetical protein
MAFFIAGAGAAAAAFFMAFMADLKETGINLPNGPHVCERNGLSPIAKCETINNPASRQTNLSGRRGGEKCECVKQVKRGVTWEMWGFGGDGGESG